MHIESAKRLIRKRSTLKLSILEVSLSMHNQLVNVLITMEQTNHGDNNADNMTVSYASLML